MDKRKQVSDQCRAIAHMADILRKVHSDYARMFQHETAMAGLEDQVGERTAVLLNKLGDVLNGIDVVQPEDEWINPIMARSRKVFPEKKCPTCSKSIPHDHHIESKGTRYHIGCEPSHHLTQ